MTSATLTEIDPPTAKSWLESGEAAIVDVREPDEHAKERIKGAKLVCLSRFDASTAAGAGRKVILHCKGGKRSMEALRMLAQAGVGAHAVSMKGGIDAWKAAGLPTETGSVKAPISVLRQMQITAGSIVLLGVILGFTVHPWLFGLSGFIGAGLVFAGLSGTCGMMTVLSKMPWNRVAN